MTKLRTCAFICSLLLASAATTPAQAQKKVSPAQAPQEEKAPLVGGVAVGADLVGLAMKGMGLKFANMEVCGRLNFREKYFPIVELGIGDCTREGGENTNKFSTTAPYYRVGMDYNFNKKVNGNRFFGGLRYAFSSYKFDFENPDFTDPVYGTSAPLRYKDLKAKKQWVEACVGVECKLWSIVRMGWSLRYKVRVKNSTPAYGEPWYAPGFGKNGNTTWGGTVNLMFDIGKSARRNSGKKKSVTLPAATSTQDATPQAAEASSMEKAEQGTETQGTTPQDAEVLPKAKAEEDTEVQDTTQKVGNVPSTKKTKGYAEVGGTAIKATSTSNWLKATAAVEMRGSANQATPALPSER